MIFNRRLGVFFIVGICVFSKCLFYSVFWSAIRWTERVSKTGLNILEVSKMRICCVKCGFVALVLGVKRETASLKKADCLRQ